MHVQINFLDHTGRTTSIRKLVDNSIDVEAIALSMYEAIDLELMDSEVTSLKDKTADYQSQENFDRRVLGHIMMQEDIKGTIPLFNAIEARAGNNPAQRATYLGVPVNEYIQIADRFNVVKDLKPKWHNKPDKYKPNWQ